MKILVCGKGGSGKSTVAALVSRELAKGGKKVLLVDADESNLGLSGLLGAGGSTLLMDAFGGRQGLKEKMKKTGLETPRPILNQPFTPADIPAECKAEAQGVQMTALGKIRNLGEGCACMIGALAKRFLENLKLAENEVCVLDMEAGVEHFGRGVGRNADLVLAVVDPSRESVLLAQRMEQMAAEAGVDVKFVVNRAGEAAAKVLADNLDASRVAATIPDVEEIAIAGLSGEPFPGDVPGVEDVCSLIEEMAAQPRKAKMRLL
ncbi:MAG: AAA family ATPase [Deltaproteobacteria bacterium]|nr:AAA family ATPase [Deltaproteobacteria bacterium]